jgi:hypothetical protein
MVEQDNRSGPTFWRMELVVVELQEAGEMERDLQVVEMVEMELQLQYQVSNGAGGDLVNAGGFAGGSGIVIIRYKFQ